MRNLWAPLASVLFLLFSSGLCLGADEGRRVTDGPITPTGRSRGSPPGEFEVPITAAEEEQARWRRDVVMPRLWQLQEREGTEDYFGAFDLGQLKRSLAQIRVEQEAEEPKQRPPHQGAIVELTLQKTIEIALKKNLRVQIAELGKDAVQTEIARARALFHPTAGVALTVSGEREFPETGTVSEVNTQTATPFIRTLVPTGASVILSGDLSRDETQGASPPTEFGASVALTIVQPLFRGGRIYVATKPIRDAEFDFRVEEARLRAEILRVTADAKSAYYDMSRAMKVIEVTEAAIQRDRTLIEASQALLRAGLVTRRDVISAEIILAQDSARLASAQADVELAKDALLDILGLPIETELVLVDQGIGFEPVPLELERWIAAATTNRPEILEIEEQLRKSLLNIRTAGNTLLPQVDLVASYERFETGSTLGRAGDLRGHVWSAGLVLSFPIGNVAARSGLARAEIEHARLQQELLQRKRQVELEVRAAVIKLRRSLARMKALTAVVDQAKDKLDVAKGRFALGVATNFDITDAQEDLLDAETDLLRAMVDYNIGLAELEASVAGPI